MMAHVWGIIRAGFAYPATLAHVRSTLLAWADCAVTSGRALEHHGEIFRRGKARGRGFESWGFGFVPTENPDRPSAITNTSGELALQAAARNRP